MSITHPKNGHKKPAANAAGLFWFWVSAAELLFHPVQFLYPGGGSPCCRNAWGERPYTARNIRQKYP